MNENIMIDKPTTKLVQTALFVTFFQYKPNMNGAKNAPAKAPQEIPIKDAISLKLNTF